MENELTIPSARPIHAAEFGGIPPLFLDSGEKAWTRFIEFFTAQIRNRNTRVAYARAVRNFCQWCEDRGIEYLEQVMPFVIVVGR